MVDAVRAAVLDVVREVRVARLGRVGRVLALRVEDDVGVARLVGGVAGLELLGGEWGCGGDGGAGEGEDGGQLHLGWVDWWDLEDLKRWMVIYRCRRESGVRLDLLPTV